MSSIKEGNQEFQCERQKHVTLKTAFFSFRSINILVKKEEGHANVLWLELHV